MRAEFLTLKHLFYLWETILITRVTSDLPLHISKPSWHRNCKWASDNTKVHHLTIDSFLIGLVANILNSVEHSRWVIGHDAECLLFSMSLKDLKWGHQANTQEECQMVTTLVEGHPLDCGQGAE